MLDRPGTRRLAVRGVLPHGSVRGGGSIPAKAEITYRGILGWRCADLRWVPSPHRSWRGLAKVKPRRIVGVMFVPWHPVYILSWVSSPGSFSRPFWVGCHRLHRRAITIEGAALQDTLDGESCLAFTPLSLGGLAGAGGGALAAATRMSVRANFASLPCWS